MLLAAPDVVLAAACLLALLGAWPARAQELAIETGLERLATWKTRVELRERGSWRLAALTVYQDAELERMAAGMESPVLVAGPLAAAGLFRGMEGPFGCGPASDMHTEATDLGLDASFAGPGRRGVLVRPLPGRLALGAFVRGESLVAFVGAAAAGGPVRWELLAAHSAPPRSRASDEWLADEPPWYGGSLVHGAARMCLELEPVGLSASAGASAAETAPHGGWVSLQARWAHPGLAAYGFAGISDGDYRDTSGALEATLAQGALRVEARAGAAAGSRRPGGSLALWAEASATRRQDGLQEAGELGSRAGWRTRALGLQGEARVRVSALGKPSWASRLELDAGRLTASAELQSDTEVRAELWWKPGPLELGGKLSSREGALQEASLSARRVLPQGRFELAAGYSPSAASPWWLSLGWELRSALAAASEPQSPTSRISRSRRKP